MRRHPRKGLLRLALVFLSAVAAVVAVGWVASLRDNRATEQAIERLQQRGTAVITRYEEQFAEQEKDKTSEDVPAEPELETHHQPAITAPERFNQVTDRVTLLMSHPHFLEIQHLQREKRWTDWSDDELRLLAELLAEYADLLEEIRRLAQRGEPLYRVDLSQGYAAELAHLAQLRTVSRLLSMEAGLLARTGDASGALENYRAIAALGEILANEPIIVSQLVRISMASLLFEDMGALLPLGQLTPEQARSFVHELSAISYREGFANALATEAMFGTAAMDRHYGAGGDVVLELSDSPQINAVLNAVYRSAIGNVLLSTDRRNYTDFMERLTEAAQAPYYEVHHELEAIEADVEGLSFLSRHTQILVPALTRVRRAQARGEALIDLMRIGLSLETHYSETGSYPDSLDAIANDLGGSVPVDPFTGQPYVYIPGEHTFTLYSVGANRLDNGGLHEYFGGDIVWRGSRPPYFGGEIVRPGSPQMRIR